MVLVLNQDGKDGRMAQDYGRNKDGMDKRIRKYSTNQITATKPETIQMTY